MMPINNLRVKTKISCYVSWFDLELHSTISKQLHSGCSLMFLMKHCVVKLEAGIDINASKYTDCLVCI